jgi:sugar phosphate isomerase/epimerase
MNRRTFFKNSVAMAAAACGIPCSSGAQPGAGAKQPLPLKIGIRAASMKMAGNLDVLRTAAGIPGIMGVELQVTAGKPNLRDWDTVRRYKREADRWGMRIPSLAGVWDRGVNISSPAAAESIRLSIRAAEMLGSNALLLAFFKKDAPDMTREDSYGPIVALLKEVAPRAADAGVVLGLENSLSPADNAKLVDLVGHPAVGVYYDLHNMAFYGHGEQAIPGVKLLGKARICAVHVKNDDKLIEEPGPIDWAAAFRAFNEIGYEGWYVYETSHASLDDCIEDTKKNNVFLRQHARMPAA